MTLFAESIGDPSPWAQFGLAGLVIFALFVVLLFVLRFAFEQHKSLNESHKEERVEWRIESGQERKENRELLKEIASKNTEAMKEVTSELRSLHEKVLDRINR